MLNPGSFCLSALWTAPGFILRLVPLMVLKQMLQFQGSHPGTTSFRKMEEAMMSPFYLFENEEIAPRTPSTLHWPESICKQRDVGTMIVLDLFVES